MFARYDLDVSYKGKFIFKGSFVSINKAIKTACCFDAECLFHLSDSLLERTFNSSTVSLLIKEFKNGEILL